MERRYLLAVIVALGVLLVASAGLNAWQWRQSGIARQQFSGDLQICTDANTRSGAVRLELEQALDVCVGQQRDVAAQMTTALAERDARLRVAARDARALRAQLEGIYALDASCRAWRDLPVCAAVSDRLRGRSTGQ